MDSSARGNPVTDAIDGATGDWSMSGDAMRWSPDLVEHTPANRDLGGLESGSGIGPVLALDVSGVRRLVSGALMSLGTVATDVVSELRQLTCGPSAEDPADPHPED